MPFIADVTEEENQHLINFFLNNAVAEKTVETGADFLNLSDVKYVSRGVTKNLPNKALISFSAQWRQ